MDVTWMILLMFAGIVGLSIMIHAGMGGSDRPSIPEPYPAKTISMQMPKHGLRECGFCQKCRDEYVDRKLKEVEAEIREKEIADFKANVEKEIEEIRVKKGLPQRGLQAAVSGWKSHDKLKSLMGEASSTYKMSGYPVYDLRGEVVAYSQCPLSEFEPCAGRVHWVNGKRMH